MPCCSVAIYVYRNELCLDLFGYIRYEQLTYSAIPHILLSVILYDLYDRYMWLKIAQQR
jgi:hypothetical protein